MSETTALQWVLVAFKNQWALVACKAGFLKAFVHCCLINRDCSGTAFQAATQGRRRVQAWPAKRANATGGEAGFELATVGRQFDRRHPRLVNNIRYHTSIIIRQGRRRQAGWGGGGVTTLEEAGVARGVCVG